MKIQHERVDSDQNLFRAERSTFVKQLLFSSPFKSIFLGIWRVKSHITIIIISCFLSSPRFPLLNWISHLSSHLLIFKILQAIFPAIFPTLQIFAVGKKSKLQHDILFYLHIVSLLIELN